MATEPVQKNETVEQDPYADVDWIGLNRRVWGYRGVREDLLYPFPYLMETPELEAFENASKEFEQARKAGATLQALKPKAKEIYEALRKLMAACKKP